MRSKRNQLLSVFSLVFSMVGLVATYNTVCAQGEYRAEPCKESNPRAEVPLDDSPPTRTLQLAEELYTQKRYDLAAIEFAKVTHSETEESAANRQRANFFMGKVLYKVGNYAASLAYFAQIVRLGRGHLYCDASQNWLVALSRVFPETSRILPQIAAFDKSLSTDELIAKVEALASSSGSPPKGNPACSGCSTSGKNHAQSLFFLLGIVCWSLRPRVLASGVARRPRGRDVSRPSGLGRTCD